MVAQSVLSGEPGWPGHEGVGEVIESNDDSLKVGDKVLTVPGYGFQRCFADYQTLPSRRFSAVMSPYTAMWKAKQHVS